jgi:hypothetical protein
VACKKGDPYLPTYIYIHVCVSDHPTTCHWRHKGRGGIALIIHNLGAVWGADCQRHDPAALPPEKAQVPTLQEAGWAPGPIRTGEENRRFLTPCRVRTTNYPGVTSRPINCAVPTPISHIYISVVTTNGRSTATDNVGRTPLLERYFRIVTGIRVSESGIRDERNKKQISTYTFGASPTLGFDQG